MKKLSLYLLILLVFISCGKTGSSESYLKVLSTTPTNSQKDANIYDPITIKFNEEIKEVSIALIDLKALEGKVEGVSKIMDDKVIFTPQNELGYLTYKVVVYKEGTISSSNKKLKENYSYTFTTYPQAVNGTPDTSEEKEEEKEEDETTTDNTNQSYTSCDLSPVCSEIKKIDTN